MRLVAGFPNPVGWAVDKAKDFVGDLAEGGFELVLGGLTAWVVDAVVWVVGGVFDFFLTATDPNVQADWFVGTGGPYATTATIGATLLTGFVLVGITQGVLSGDTAGMLRRMALDLPLAVLGMVGLVSVTQALLALTDALSRGVLHRFGEDVADFTAVVTSLASLQGSVATAFVVFLLGLVTVLAGIVVVAELVVRSALVYVVVALAPLVFAAQLWPALRGAGRKLLELLFAVVVSKLVIAVALAVAAAAVVGAGSGGEVRALPAPEVVAADPGGSVTQAVGILLAAIAAFGVSAFSPLLLVKLLPLTEAALVAQGVKGAPVRAAQQAVTMGYYTRYARGSVRHSDVAAGGSGGEESAAGGHGAKGGADAGAKGVAGPGATGGAGPGATGVAGPGAKGASGGGGAGGGAAAGAAAAAAARAAQRGADAATTTAETGAEEGAGVSRQARPAPTSKGSAAGGPGAPPRRDERVGERGGETEPRGPSGPGG